MGKNVLLIRLIYATLGVFDRFYYTTRFYSFVIQCFAKDCYFSLRGDYFASTFLASNIILH
ncbi:MAG: hypothetical protein ACRCX5_05900, partial [Bacteroidales bacterium]